MLTIIGIGLDSYEDITLKGLRAIQDSELVYLESYTSIQRTPVSCLEDLIGKKVILADRAMVESSDVIITNAKTKNVAFLVVGSPMFATTHIDFLTRAKEENITVSMVHNASIFDVIGCCGLYSYAFGRTVSVPYFTSTWKPTSFYTYILDNYKLKLHTLCLLDIQAEENRFMIANDAMRQLLYCEEKHNGGIIKLSTKIFVICRFGSPDQLITYDTIENLLCRDFGRPLHTLIIPAPMDVIEREFVEKHFEVRQ